jgi:hypothetical protein
MSHNRRTAALGAARRALTPTPTQLSPPGLGWPYPENPRDIIRDRYRMSGRSRAYVGPSAPPEWLLREYERQK